MRDTRKKKDKVVVNHTITIKENSKTGDMEVSCKLQQPDGQTGNTDGQYLAVACTKMLGSESGIGTLVEWFKQYKKGIDLVSEEEGDVNVTIN